MAAISAALQQCKKSGKDPGGEGSSSRRGRSGAPAPLDLERGSNYLAGPGAYRVLGPRRFLVPTNARGNENGERGSRDGSLEEQAARADLEGAEIAASSAGRRASSAPLTSTALSTGTGPETMLYPVEASLVDHRTAGGRRNTAGESESCACGGGSTMWPSNRTACPGGRAAVGVCSAATEASWPPEVLPVDCAGPDGGYRRDCGRDSGRHVCPLKQSRRRHSRRRRHRRRPQHRNHSSAHPGSYVVPGRAAVAERFPRPPSGRFP